MEHWIWLSQIGMTKHMASVLVKVFGSPAGVYQASEAELDAVEARFGPGSGAAGVRGAENLTERNRQRLRCKDLTEARRVVEVCRRSGWEILSILDPRYPQKLRCISDAPLVLYVWGKMPAVDEGRSVGVVGTRNASPYGLTHTRRISRELAEQGTVIVSGGALGVDTAALEGALETGAPVIAVVAGGLDRLYPAQNQSLFARIARQGCVVSQYTPGTSCLRHQFLARNRIISALSDGTLVTECPLRSGAMSTARHARSQGRQVFALPGPVGDGGFAGCHDLIRSGAILVENAGQLLEALPAPARWGKAGAQEGAGKICVDKHSSRDYIDTHKETWTPGRAPEAVTQLQRRVFGELETAPGNLQELSRRLGEPDSRLLEAVTELQLLGRIAPWPDGRYHVNY